MNMNKKDFDIEKKEFNQNKSDETIIFKGE